MYTDRQINTERHRESLFQFLTITKWRCVDEDEMKKDDDYDDDCF